MGIVNINNKLYESNTWKAGDTVTSAKLNNIEEGILNSSGTFVVNMDSEGYLDKTWQEIQDGNYYFVVSKWNNEPNILPSQTHKDIFMISSIYIDGADYVIRAITTDQNYGMHDRIFETDDKNSYPQIVGLTE